MLPFAGQVSLRADKETALAACPPGLPVRESRASVFRRIKQFLVGSPLETASLHEQRLSKKEALAVLASDNLSSTAYATEELLLALMAGAALGTLVPTVYAIPIAAAIVGLTFIVAISYGQTLHA